MSRAAGRKLLGLGAGWCCMMLLLVGCQQATIEGAVQIRPVAEWDGISQGPVLFPVPQHGKWGYMDASGRLVIDYQYDDAQGFSDGMAAVKIGDRWGYITEDGALAIPPQYWVAPPFNCGLAQCYPASGRGYIDKTGRLAIEPQAEWVEGQAYEFSEGLAAVMLNDGGYGYIDTSGQLVLRLSHAENVGDFSEGLAAVETARGYGYINRTGEFVIEPQFLYGATAFSGGRAIVEYEFMTFRIIDSRGNTIRDLDYDQVSSLSDGRAAVLVGGFVSDILNGTGESEEPRWGYIDQDGNEVVAPGYRIADRYRGGLAWVEGYDGTMAYIDSQGRYVWQAQ